MSSMAYYQEQEARDAEEGMEEYRRYLRDKHDSRRREIIPFLRREIIKKIKSEDLASNEVIERFVNGLEDYDIIVSRNYIMSDDKKQNYKNQYWYDFGRAMNDGLRKWKNSRSIGRVSGDIELTDFRSARGLRKKSRRRKSRKSRNQRNLKKHKKSIKKKSKKRKSRKHQRKSTKRKRRHRKKTR